MTGAAGLRGGDGSGGGCRGQSSLGLSSLLLLLAKTAARLKFRFVRWKILIFMAQYRPRSQNTRARWQVGENPHLQNQEFSRPPWIILILLNIQIFIGKLCPMCEDKWCWCAVTVHQRTLYSAVQYSTVQDHNNNISALCCQNQQPGHWGSSQQRQQLQ